MKPARLAITFLLLIGMVINAAPIGAVSDPVLLKWQKLRDDARLRIEMQALLEIQVRKIFQQGTATPTPLSDFFNGSVPHFVTLKKGERVRGCMGSLQTQRGSLDAEILENLRRASFQDPWHPEVRADEMPGMTIYLTAVGKARPVRAIGEISPAYDGALLRQGNREAVVLPGEAKTQRYLLALLKSKAGIDSRQTFQLYRLKTVSVGFTLPEASAEPRRN